MREVFDSIREHGSANARTASASDVVLTTSGVAARQWRMADDTSEVPAAGTLIPLARWLALADQGDAPDLIGLIGQVGVVIEPDSDITALRPYLARVPIIAIHYPRFGDGRGYSHARRLRHLWGYGGKLLAVGDVLRDQLVWMWRVGIDQFHLRADQDPIASQRAFTLYSAYYQY